MDTLFIDEGEARDLASDVSLVRCARRIMEFGPKAVVIKRGEHGVTCFMDVGLRRAGTSAGGSGRPTGAGDCFAGGFLGYLAATGDLSPEAFRRAAVLGSVMGSFAVESFSVDRISSLTQSDIDARFRAFTGLSHFAPLGAGESLPWRDDL